MASCACALGCALLQQLGSGTHQGLGKVRDLLLLLPTMFKVIKVLELLLVVPVCLKVLQDAYTQGAVVDSCILQV